MRTEWMGVPGGCQEGWSLIMKDMELSHERVSIYCEINGLYIAFVNEELALIIRLMSAGQV